MKEIYKKKKAEKALFWTMDAICLHEFSMNRYQINRAILITPTSIKEIAHAISHPLSEPMRSCKLESFVED
jgi:hypothetical protein